MIEDSVRLTKFLIFFSSETEGYRVTVNGQELCLYNHRSAPQAVNGLFVSGRVKLFKISYNCPSVSFLVTIRCRVYN